MKLINIVALVLGLFVFANFSLAIELNSSQMAYIDNWLTDNGFNEYGDPKGTTYMGGSPLFDEHSGQMVDRYEYVLRSHPELLDHILNISDRNTLAQLETEYEMACKDYQLELNKEAPDKEKLENLQKRIKDLRARLEKMYALTASPKRNILPAVFSEEISAALDSSDYGRVCELVYNLKELGQDTFKYEAEHLFSLNRQLRYRLVNESTDKVSEVRQALSILEPMLETLKGLTSIIEG